MTTPKLNLKSSFGLRGKWSDDQEDRRHSNQQEVHFPQKNLHKKLPQNLKAKLEKMIFGVKTHYFACLQ